MRSHGHLAFRTMAWATQGAKTVTPLPRERLTELLPPGGRIAVLEQSRHANKIRLGHLAGNRFELGIAGISLEDCQKRVRRLFHHGLVNRFGSQRFGIGHASLHLAEAWAAQDFDRVARLLVDNDQGWQVGDDIPPGFRSGPEGKIIGALRRGLTPAKALRAGGETMRQLVASAAQSAIFNAILDGRIAEGLLHRPRVGEVACIRSGALFVVTAEELADVERRAQPGVLDAFATAPLPGATCRHGDEASLAAEQAWSAETGIAWDWFAKGTPLESPGTRRPVVVPLRAEPTVTEQDNHLRVEISLPAGAYATEALAQMDIAVPLDRRG
jgi:tRNA pseudouridine13 synthase